MALQSLCNHYLSRIHLQLSQSKHSNTATYEKNYNYKTSSAQMKTNYLLRNQQSSIRISQSGNHMLAAVLECIIVEKPGLEIRLQVVVVAPMYIATALENFHVEVPSFMDLRSVVMGEDDYTFRAKFTGEGVSTFSEVVKEKLKEFTGEYTDYTFVV